MCALSVTVTLTQTRKKGLELKQKMIEDVSILVSTIIFQFFDWIFRLQHKFDELWPRSQMEVGRESG